MLGGLMRDLLERDWTPEADTEVKRWVQAGQRWEHELWTDREVLDWYDTTSDLRRRAERVLGPDAHGRWLGPCPVPECVGEVRMGDDQAAAVCPECGGFVTREQQHAYVLEIMGERLMTLSEIATALVTVGADTPYESVRTWARRGRLTEHEEGSGVYRFLDAFAIAAKRTTRILVRGSAA